ncbi:MAG: hypothetical protein WD407_08475 [Rhodospirillales bacterium]
MKRFLCLTVILSAFALAAPPAVAEEGMLNAVSYEKFGRDTPISVRPLDNSDVNVALKEVFEASLREKGYTVIDNAGVILSFDTRSEGGAWSDAGDRALIELKNQEGTSHSNEPEVRLNLFNSSRGGVLNQGNPGTKQVSPTMYRVDVMIENGANGQRMWEGWAMTELRMANEIPLSQAMVPVLVDNLGKTIRQKTFNLF